MPSLNSYVMVSLKKDSTSTASSYIVDPGTTIEDFLSTDGGLSNPSKFTILVNGEEVDDLDQELEPDDIVEIRKEHYSSGC